MSFKSTLPDMWGSCVCHVLDPTGGRPASKDGCQECWEERERSTVRGYHNYESMLLEPSYTCTGDAGNAFKTR